MNREIKFRVWDNVDYMSTPFTLQDIILRNIEFTSDCEVMRFTGLKDKNGKEIYEGDIVEDVASDTKYEIWFGDYGWCIKFKNHAVPMTNDFVTHLEVVGNIYETKPETEKL